MCSIFSSLEGAIKLKYAPFCFSLCLLLHGTVIFFTEVKLFRYWLKTIDYSPWSNFTCVLYANYICLLSLQRSVPASIARPTGSDVAPPPAISLLPSFSPQASSHNHPTPQQLPSYHTLPVQLSHQLTSRREKNLALKRFNSVEVLFQESSESDSELDEVYPLYSEHLQHRRRHSFSRAVSTSSLDDTLSPSYGSPPFDVKFRRNRTELTSTSVYGVISGKGVGEAGGNVKVMESMLTDELLTTRHRHGSFSSVGSGSTIHIVTAEHIMEEIRSRPPLDGGGGSEEEPSGEYVTVGLDSPEGGGGGGEGGGEGRGEEGGGGVMNTIFSLAPLSLAVGALIALYLRR